MPLKLALAVRETAAGHRLGALEEGGGGMYLTPCQCIAALNVWPCTTQDIDRCPAGEAEPTPNGGCQVVRLLSHADCKVCGVVGVLDDDIPAVDGEDGGAPARCGGVGQGPGPVCPFASGGLGS